MLYLIIGTNTKIRESARKELAQLGGITRRLYQEDIHAIKPLLDVSSLFGDTTIVECVQMLDHPAAKEHIYELLEDIERTETIFIIDEPFADAHKVNKLAKFSKKIFDAREEKPKDGEVFTLADYFIKRDKKNAWMTWRLLKEKHEGESIQGAIWWKFAQVWQATLTGKKTAFTKEECEKIGGMLVRSVLLAHSGKADLNEELEKIILSL